MDPDERRAAPPEFFSAQVTEARRFYLDLAPPSTQALAVVCGGCEQSGRTTKSTVGRFLTTRSSTWLGGTGTLALDGGTHRLLPGSVFVYGPHVRQDIATDRSDPLVKYFVDFAGSQALRMLQQHELAPGVSTHVSALGEIEATFDALVRDGCRGTGFATELCAALLRYLVLKIAESRVPAAPDGLPPWRPTSAADSTSSTTATVSCRWIKSLASVWLTGHTYVAYSVVTITRRHISSSCVARCIWRPSSFR